MVILIVQTDLVLIIRELIVCYRQINTVRLCLILTNGHINSERLDISLFSQDNSRTM